MYFTRSPRLPRIRKIQFSVFAFAALFNFIFPQHAVAGAMSDSVRPDPSIQCLSVEPPAADKPSQLPIIESRRAKRTTDVLVTAYSSTVDQTDADPFTTASGTTVRDGTIAINSLPFGTRVRFPEAFGDKIFVVEDRLNARASRSHADIWMPDRDAALQWGKRVLRMEVL